MRKISTAIIGAGASGILAAISAKKSGEDAVICEKMSRPGKKILASGNGRCNLLNEDLDPSHYNTSARQLVNSIFNKYGKDDIKKMFESFGLKLYSELDGRVFPVTNQSASVLSVLEMALKDMGVPVEFNFDVCDAVHSKDGFVLTSKTGKKIVCENLILAGGGRSYPSFGSDGSAYKIAKGFGHTIIEPVPSAVPLCVKDPLCHILQGTKISAKGVSVIEGQRGQEVSGDLLFTKYGLSGTLILDISEDISIAMNRCRKKEVEIIIDMAPFEPKETLKAEIAKRLGKKVPAEEMLVGILPNKMASALKNLFKERDPEKAALGIKEKHFKVSGTRGWNEADFTAGGINTSEVDPSTLGSKLQKGLYFAGEILDVTGSRGGYNLAWAWASGYTAGQTG